MPIKCCPEIETFFYRIFCATGYYFPQTKFFYKIHLDRVPTDKCFVILNSYLGIFQGLSQCFIQLLNF